LDEVAASPAGAGYTLNISLVYQDEKTQEWAREVHAKVARLAGKECVRSTWWKMEELEQPGVLAGAVSTAMRADMIVVAVDAAQGLSLPFNVWVNTWLPNRLRQAGCLVALIGSKTKADSQANKAADYLRAVAQAGRFDFLIEERVAPEAAAIRFPQAPIWKRNGASGKAIGRIAAWGRAASANEAWFAPAVLAY
jgi:hypothetical protein